MTVQLPACVPFATRPPANLAGKPHGFRAASRFHVAPGRSIRELLIDLAL